MGQAPEGKRRAVERVSIDAPATPADIARMWSAASAAHSVLGKRTLYFLASDVEGRMAEQLSLIPMLQDWVTATSGEAAELTGALRAYVGTDVESPRDREAEALRFCIRAMTVYRARSAIPFPPEEDGFGGVLIS